MAAMDTSDPQPANPNAHLERLFPVADPWDTKRGSVVDGENIYDVSGKRAGKRLDRILGSRR